MLPHRVDLVGEKTEEIRVVHVSPYRFAQVSGITQVIALLEAELRPLGVRIHLRCPGNGEATGSLEVRPLAVRTKIARNLALAAQTLISLLQDRSRIDLVHVHQPHVQSLAALLAAKIIGVPSVLTLHVRVPSAGLRRALAGSLVAAQATLANRVVSVSDRVGRDFGLMTCTIIHNGVRLHEATATNASELQLLVTRRPPLDLVFAGRVTRTKGIYVLLDALSRAEREVPGIRLTTFGSIDSPEEYEAAKKSLSIAQHVSDRGYDSGWRHLLGPGQVFVLPSYYEGMPMAILEAMAAGLPAVATPVGGIPEVVLPNRTGLLVPVGDAEALSKAFVWLAKHPDTAFNMGLEARQFVEAHFSASAMAAAYAKLYRSCVTARARDRTWAN